MENVKNYWVNKEARSVQAAVHTKEMDMKYPAAINYSVINTQVIDSNMFMNQSWAKKDSMPVDLYDTDSVTAVQYANSYLGGCALDKKVAVLNFASFKNPGGGFLAGSKAQEECLCHASFLYNVLREFKDTFYKKNNTMLNRALYHNRGLYTPGVVFGHTLMACDADVITVAAPNKTAAKKYQNITEEENYEALVSRIEFVLDIAAANEVDILILGAFGCGVFGQDPTETAEIFKELLSTSHKCFEHVIFAIPDGDNGNLKAFKEVFEGEE